MNQDILQRLTETLVARKQASPESSYVAKLFSKGEDAILKKIGDGSYSCQQTRRQKPSGV
jgi:phosphoribosyl-ATP pyrophosphohydrolase